MPKSRFKSLLYSAGFPVVPGVGVPTSTGSVFFVNSNGTPGDGSSPDKPLLLITAALAKCTASKGDVIIVMPGHAETWAVAPTLVAGVYIVGLGWGNLRPTITGNAAIALTPMNVANVVIDNLIFAAPNVDNQTSAIAITAAGCMVTRCHFVGSQTAKNVTDVITVSADGHNARIVGNTFENATVDVVTFITVSGAANDVVISDNVAIGNCSTAVLLVSAVATLMKVMRNTFVNTKAATIAVSFSSNATGIQCDNYVGGLGTTLAANSAWGTAMRSFNSFTTEEAGGASGALIPAVDTD
jgi:hypothetical protein